MPEIDEFEKLAKDFLYKNWNGGLMFNNPTQIIAEALREVHDRAVEECLKQIVPDGNPQIAIDKIRRLKKSNS